MLLKVDFSKEHFRILFNELYNRVANFNDQIGENSNIVKARFTALVANDASVQLLVNFNDQAQIDAHCLFVLHLQPDNSITCFCEQILVDSKHDESFVKECIAYAESIPNVTRISMFTEEKKAKAFNKKYGFESFKVLMTRNVMRNQEES